MFTSQFIIRDHLTIQPYTKVRKEDVDTNLQNIVMDKNHLAHAVSFNNLLLPRVYTSVLFPALPEM